MKVFISWSGDRSRALAEAFNEWLPLVVQAVEPFFSPEIEKGSRGVEEINQNLADSNYGILCLTPENLGSEWIHYEAGALSKISDVSRVWPFLCRLKPTEITGPLAQFQNTVNGKQDVFRLVQSIHKHSGSSLTTEVLNESFETFWPRLEAKLELAAEMTQPAESTVPVRSDRDMIQEILELLRRSDKAQWPMPAHRSVPGDDVSLESLAFLTEAAIHFSGRSAEDSASKTFEYLRAKLANYISRAFIKRFDGPSYGVMFTFKPKSLSVGTFHEYVNQSSALGNGFPRTTSTTTVD